MAANRPGNMPPPKPWEKGGGTSGPAPFKPPSHGSTSQVVEASGTARPGEIVSNTTSSIATRNVVGIPLPARPWHQSRGVNSGYQGSSMYNRGGWVGRPIGGYGYGAPDPNNPAPPGFWISFLRVLEGVVNVFGRISMLIDENIQVANLFLSSLLQLVDRSGMLYSELARFVLRLLGVRTKPRKVQQPEGPPEALPHPAPENSHANQSSNAQPKAAPTGGWDSLWGNAGS